MGGLFVRSTAGQAVPVIGLLVNEPIGVSVLGPTTK